MLKKGGGGWSVVRVPDSALVPEGAGVRAAGGLYVGVCVCEACGFVCGVGELLGWYGVECTCAARGLQVRQDGAVACDELCVGPAASCDLRRAVVEPSSFVVGCAGWALHRLRCWVMWILQVAERGDAG